MPAVRVDVVVEWVDDRGCQDVGQVDEGQVGGWLAGDGGQRTGVSAKIVGVKTWNVKKRGGWAGVGHLCPFDGNMLAFVPAGMAKSWEPSLRCEVCGRQADTHGWMTVREDDETSMAALMAVRLRDEDVEIQSVGGKL
jgi:hypothetical protein